MIVKNIYIKPCLSRVAKLRHYNTVVKSVKPELNTFMSQASNIWIESNE